MFLVRNVKKGSSPKSKILPIWSEAKKTGFFESAKLYQGFSYLLVLCLLSSLGLSFFYWDPPNHDSTENIAVHVLLYKRPENARLLLADLSRTHYGRANVPLYITVDTDPNHSAENAEVIRIAKRFRWRHGEKSVEIKSKHTDVREIWLALGHTCSYSSMFAVFEDDIRLSPQWFRWAMKVKNIYFDHTEDSLYSNTSPVGLSLTPIRVGEMKYPYKSWDSNRKVPLNQSVFLHNLPSSWAPIFDCLEWNQFLQYARERVTTVFMNLNDTAAPMQGAPLGDPNFNIPDCHSNIWNNSWKRLLLEYCFLLGKTMMYPNFLGRAGFASNMHIAGGAHVTHEARIDPRTNPLVIDNTVFTDGFPVMEDLVVFDVLGYKTSLSTLKDAGRNMQRTLFKLGEPYRKVMEALPIVKMDSFEQESRFILPCPDGSMYTQLIRFAKSLGLAKQIYSGVLLSHLFIESANEYVPYSEVFEMNHKVNGTVLKAATRNNLKYLKPNHALSLENEKKDVRHCIHSYGRLWNASTSIEIVHTGDKTHAIREKLQRLPRIAVVEDAVFDASSSLDFSGWISKALRTIAKPNIRTQILSDDFAKSRKVSFGAICLELPEQHDCLYQADLPCEGALSRILRIIKDSYAAKIVLLETGSLSETRRSIGGFNDMWKIVNSADALEFLGRKTPAMSRGLLEATARVMMLQTCLKSSLIFAFKTSDAGRILGDLLDTDFQRFVDIGSASSSV